MARGQTLTLPRNQGHVPRRGTCPEQRRPSSKRSQDPERVHSSMRPKKLLGLPDQALESHSAWRVTVALVAPGAWGTLDG